MENRSLLYPQHEPEIQLKLLGISKKDLSELRKRKLRVLDIGCGEEARLVQYLWENGIEAEGIDPFAKINSPNIMKSKISQENPEVESIPRQDKRYHLILSHANFVLPMGLSTCRNLGAKMLAKKGEHPKNIGRRLDAVSLDAQWTVLEAMRTLKNQGRFVCYPGLTQIGEIMGDDFWETPIKIVHEEVPSRYHQEHEFMKNRTIIYKL